MKLFISYSHNHKNFIFELAKKLNEDVQHDVWIDKKLTGAQLWWETILNSIEACHCFIIILTPESVASMYCNAEVNYALALGKPVLPLMLRSCTPPANLARIQYINIEGLGLTEVLLYCSVALHTVEIDLLREAPTILATVDRPRLPEPDANVPQHIIEVFAAAEDAVAAGDIALADDLFRKVIEVDQNGLGVPAKVRLSEVHTQRERQGFYERITEMINKGQTNGAKAVWQTYTQIYGIVYDPNHYAEVFSPTGRPTPTGDNAAPKPNHWDTVSHPVWSKSKPVSDVPSVFSDKNPSAMQPPPNLIVLPVSDGASIRTVPASKFVFGNGQILDLPEFHIDAFLVTNEDYQRFVIATGAHHPWRSGYIAAKAHHPVVGITYQEAESYATWVGKRLPTVAEWEKAARGTDGRQFPWGNSFDSQFCNTLEGSIKSTTPVGRYTNGASPYGVYDMAGNVWEWTSSEIPSRGVGAGIKKVLKGGSWQMSQRAAVCSESSSAKPTDRREDIGFRCVRD